MDNEEIGKEMADLLRNINPEIKELLKVYMSAKNSEERKFAGVFLILKFPGMKPYLTMGAGRLTQLNEIDSLRDNWWCGPNSEIQEPGKETKLDFPLFFNEDQKQKAQEEFKKISAIQTGPNELCNIVIKWANKKPEDERIPEALHLSVKATRYGCTDDKTTILSKTAFKILHKKYPESSWAEKTKYWF